MAHNIAGNTGETYADNFATAYGYGKEIIEFRKFSTDSSIISKLKTYVKDPKIADNNVIFSFQAIYSLFLNTLIVFGSSYGSDMSAMDSQISMLEKEINKPGYNNAIRKVMINDLNEIKKMKNKILDLTNKDKTRMEKYGDILKKVINFFSLGTQFDYKTPLNNLVFNDIGKLPDKLK